MYRVPRKIKQKYSAQRRDDKVDEIKTTLIDLGYLKKKKMSPKRKKGAKGKKQDEDEGEFEEECE